MTDGPARRRPVGRPRGGGDPVEPRLRRSIETTTGESLESARVHQGQDATDWVDRLGARGVTVGSDVVLGSRAGDGLERDLVLAHELAHVAQQSDARGDDVDLTPSAAAETDADRVVAGWLLGRRVHVAPSGGLALRRCDDPPSHVEEAAEAAEPLSGYETMVRGGVPAVDAAERMQLPQEMTDAMADAWANSFPGGSSMEQGGILAETEDGTLEFVDATSTTGGRTDLPWSSVPGDATPLLDAHTHPYDAGEGGFLGVAFSGADFKAMVDDPTSVSIVHAGDRFFAIAKTKEFEDHVNSLSPDDREAYGDEIDIAYFEAHKAAGGDTVSSAREATMAVCRKYNLVLYEGGLDGSLERVDTSE